MRDGVYVATSSKEIDRASRWMSALRAKGIKVTSTWIDVISAQPNGEANPRDASDEQKQTWCLKDVREALGSQVFWLLMPEGPMSFGASFEYGFYVALSPDLEQAAHVVSGDYRKSIFTSFSTCFDTDEAAFAAILSLLGVEEPATNENAVTASTP